MKIKQIILLSLCSFFLSSANAGYIINEYATGLSSSSYTASSSYIPSSSAYQAENAFNGTGGYWNAGDLGWAWVQADMGISQTLTELKLTIAQSLSGVTQHQVFLSDTYIGSNYSSLTPIFSRSGYTIAGQVIDITLDQDYSGQFLLILSNGGSTWTALGDLNPQILWNQTPPQKQQNTASNNIPEPSILALLGLGLLSISLARRKLKTS